MSPIIPAHLSHGRQIIAHYHELRHLEQSFCMSKHDLKARSIFHHTKDAIQTHLTIVTAALALARHLYQATGITAPQLVKKLIDLQKTTSPYPTGNNTPPTPKTIPKPKNYPPSWITKTARVRRTELQTRCR